MRAAALGLAMMWLAGAVQAQGFSFAASSGSQDWQAVGRLELGGTAFCTGALIAPDLVLTAAHCLYDDRTGTPFEARQLRFLAGFRDGAPSAFRRIEAIAHPNDYVFAEDEDYARIANDVAVLRLQHSIRDAEVVPFETGQDVPVGSRVNVVSYNEARDLGPELKDRCDIMTVQDGLFVMNCTVVGGNSGSPVFDIGSGTPRIVAVVSSRARTLDRDVALGVSLSETLPELIAEVRASGRFKSVTARDPAATGAKFIRP